MGVLWGTVTDGGTGEGIVNCVVFVYTHSDQLVTRGHSTTDGFYQTGDTGTIASGYMKFICSGYEEYETKWSSIGVGGWGPYDANLERV